VGGGRSEDKGRGNLAGDQGKVAQEQRKVAEDRGKVPEDQMKVPEDQMQVPEDRRKVAEDRMNLAAALGCRGGERGRVARMSGGKTSVVLSPKGSHAIAGGNAPG
jgi:hypothetical protein